jgi:ABC-type taurine transport system ATPase subunit
MLRAKRSKENGLMAGEINRRSLIGAGAAGPGASLLAKVTGADSPGALDALTRMRLQDKPLRNRTDRRVTMILITHDVVEEVFRGDRVLVTQPHAGRITQDIALDLPRPRDCSSPRLKEIRQRILLETGAVPALAA